MKKVLSMLLVGIMLFALSACTSNNSVIEETSPTSETESLTSEATSSTAESTAPVSEEATETTSSTKALVVYFSWSSSHNTQTMAEYVAAATGGDLFRIEPETPYTTDYNEVLDVAQEELRNNARPTIAESITQEQLDSYEVVFVGYPVWWYDAPMIIYSFMESLNFSGKTVVTFATSGGSSISDSNLKSNINATFLEGLCIPNFSAGDSSRDRVNTWVEDLGYSK